MRELAQKFIKNLVPKINLYAPCSVLTFSRGFVIFSDRRKAYVEKNNMHMPFNEFDTVRVRQKRTRDN